MADYYNDQQEIDSMGVLNTPVDSGMDAISINNETSSDLNNNLGGLRSAINGLSHQVTSLAKSTLQMGKDVGQSLTKDFYIEKEGGMMRAAAAMTGPIGAIAAKAINDSGVGDKIAGSVKSGLSKGVGVIGNKVRSMFGGRSRYDSQSGMLSPMTMSKISANGTETMVKEMNHGVTTPLIEANKYHKEHLNETKRGNQSIVRSIEDLGDTLTGVQNKRTGAKSNLQKQQEAELSHRRSDYGKTHAKSVKVPEQVVSTGSSTVSSNSDNTAVIEAINNLGSKFEEFSDPSANKGGGLLRTVGGLAFAFSGLDALFRGRYANDITKNKNPLITITDAQIQIYRWTRLYGELQKRQLNEIIKKLGGQQKEVVGKRGWLWESGAAKQWADELSEKGGFFNKLGSFALKAGSFLNYDPEEYLNERVAKAEKGREKLSQRKQKMGGVGEFFSTINTDMSDKQVDEGVERLHNRRRRGYDEKGNRQFAKGGWITKPVLIDDGSTVSKTKMFKDGGFIPPAIAGEAGKEGIVPISKEKGNLTTKLASTISDIIFERAKDHVTKGKKDPIPGILIEISKNVKSLEKNSHKSTKSIGEIAKAEKEENDTHNAEEFKKQSDERFKSSQKKDKGSKGIFGALGGIGNFFMKHPMLVAGALAMLMFPGATKAFGGWMMGGVDKFAKGLTMIGKGKKTIVNTGKALVKTAGHAAKVAAHGAKSGAGVMKGLQAGFKTTGIVKAVRSVSALMKGGKGLFGAIGGVAAKSIGKTVAKGGMKALFKRIPIVGSVLSILFAINRFKKGEIRGGIIECLSGLAGLLDLIAPGVGTGVSLLLDILNVFLDSKMKKNPMDGIKQPKKQEMSTGKKVLRGLPFIGGFVRLYDSFGHFKNKKWGKGLYDLATGLGGMVDFVIPGAGTGIMLLSDLVKHFVGGKDEAEGTKKTDQKKQEKGVQSISAASDHAKKGNKVRATYFGIKGAKELSDATTTSKVEPVSKKVAKPTQSGTVTINGREVKVTKNADGTISRKSNAVTTTVAPKKKIRSIKVDQGKSKQACQDYAEKLAVKYATSDKSWSECENAIWKYLDNSNLDSDDQHEIIDIADLEYRNAKNVRDQAKKTGHGYSKTVNKDGSVTIRNAYDTSNSALSKAIKARNDKLKSEHDALEASYEKTKAASGDFWKSAKSDFEARFDKGGFVQGIQGKDTKGNKVLIGEKATEAVLPIEAKNGNLTEKLAESVSDKMMEKFEPKEFRKYFDAHQLDYLPKELKAQHSKFGKYKSHSDLTDSEEYKNSKDNSAYELGALDAKLSMQGLTKEQIESNKEYQALQAKIAAEQVRKQKLFSDYQKYSSDLQSWKATNGSSYKYTKATQTIDGKGRQVERIGFGNQITADIYKRFAAEQAHKKANESQKPLVKSVSKTYGSDTKKPVESNDLGSQVKKFAQREGIKPGESRTYVRDSRGEWNQYAATSKKSSHIATSTKTVKPVQSYASKPKYANKLDQKINDDNQNKTLSYTATMYVGGREITKKHTFSTKGKFYDPIVSTSQLNVGNATIIMRKHLSGKTSRLSSVVRIEGDDPNLWTAYDGNNNHVSNDQPVNDKVTNVKTDKKVLTQKSKVDPYQDGILRQSAKDIGSGSLDLVKSLTGYNLAKETIKGTGQGFKDVYKYGVKKGVGNLVNGVVAVPMEVGKGLLKGTGQALGGVAKGVGQAGWGALKGTGQVLGGVGKGAWEVTKGVGSAIWNPLAGVGKGLWKGGVKGVGGGLLDILKGNGEEGVDKILKGIGIAATEVVKGLGKGAWGLIKGVGKGAWEAVKGLGKGVWSLTKGIGKGLWSAATGIVKGIGSLAKGVVKGAWGLVKGTAKGVWNIGKAIVALPKNIVKGVAKGAIATVTGIWKGANKVTKGLMKAAKGAWQLMTGKITWKEAWQKAKQKVTPGSSKKKKAGLLPVSSKALSKEELDKKYRKQLADKIREISKDEGFVKQYKDDITSTVRNPSFTLQEKLSKLSGMWEDWNVFKNGGKINTNVKDENLKKKLEFQKAVNKAEAAKMYSSKIQSIEDKAAKATEDQKKDTKSKTIKAPVYGKAKDISSMLGEMEYAKIPYGNATIVKERRSNTVIGNDVTGIKEDVVRDVYQKYYQSGKYKKDPVVQSASVNVGNAQIVKRTHKSGRNTSLNSSIWYSPEYGLWTESKNESATKKAEFEARFTGKQAPTTIQKAQSASKGVTAKATEVNKKPSIFTRATNWLKEKLFSSKSSTDTKKKSSSFNKMTASEKLRRAKAAKDFKGTGAIAGDKKDDKQQLFKEVKEAARNKVPSFIVDQLISDYTRSHDLDWSEEEFLEMKAKMIYNQELVNNDPASKKQTYTDKNGNKVTKVSGSISQIDLTKKWNQTTKDAKVSGDTVSIGPYQFSKKFYDSVMDEAKNGARSISYEQLIKDFSGNNSADPFDDGGAFYSDAHKVLKSVEKKTKSDTSISAVAQKVLYDKASKKYYDERNNYYNEVIKKGKVQSASKGVTAKATEVNKSNTKSQPETIDESKRLDSKRLDEIKSTQKLEATNKVYAHRKANEDLKSSVEDGTKKTVNASNVTANKIVKSVNNQTIINQANKESNPADFYTPLAGVNTSNLI